MVNPAQTLSTFEQVVAALVYTALVQAILLIVHAISGDFWLEQYVYPVTLEKYISPVIVSTILGTVLALSVNKEFPKFLYNLRLSDVTQTQFNSAWYKTMKRNMNRWVVLHFT